MKSSLNHIYRTIWSEALSAWVAVSELTSAKGDRSGSSALKAALIASIINVRNSFGWSGKLRFRPLALALICCFSFSAQANPIGAQVVNGVAAINQSGNTLSVTNTPSAIINWQSFSINTGETTRFVQQSASSAVLNRVLGADPSQLLGTLTSNGKVFLINPAGILVGQGARIDVAGFVASTLNLSNADFIAGKLNFGLTPNAGSIQNAGSIITPDGGTVYLVAPQVANTGFITTPKGETILAAGNTVQLVDTATPGVTVQITGSNTNATNIGQILADSGRIGMVAATLKNSGTFSASSLVNQGGRIFLKATQSVTLDAGSITSAFSGNGNGGTIEVLGNQVAVAGNVDASGASGGGTILVGGDAHGANPLIQNAQNTFVASTATLNADGGVPSLIGGGLGWGNGGKVIVWADDTARIYGNISARGGALGGNGGFVETSGRHFLDVANAANVSAPNGKGGTWLLDPYNITVVAGVSGTGTLDLLPNFTTNADNSTITNTVIHNALNAGTSVVLGTGAATAGTQAGDITINAPITVTGQGQGTWSYPALTLNAANNIFINSPITKDPAAATTTYFYLYLNHNALNTAPGSSVTLASSSMIRGVDYINLQSAGAWGTGTLHILGATNNAPTGYIGGGTAQNFHYDDSWFAYPLPFGFTFYGVTYTTMYVSSNGIITFGSGTRDYTNTTAKFMSAYKMIAPSWFDWTTYGDATKDIYIHQPNASSIVVRWDVAECCYNTTTPTTPTANFEAILAQSGNIAFNYGTANNLPFRYSTIGVSNGDNSHFTLSALSNTYFLNYLPSATFSYNSLTGNYVETLAGSIAAPAPAILAPAITAAVAATTTATNAVATTTTTTTPTPIVVVTPPPITTTSGATMVGPAGGTIGGTTDSFGATDTSAPADSGNGAGTNKDNGNAKDKDSIKEKPSEKPEKC